MTNFTLIKSEAKTISNLYSNPATAQKADRILKELKQPERQLLQKIISNSYPGNPLNSEVVQLLKKLQDMQAPDYQFTRDNGFWANLMRRIKNAFDRIDSSTIRRQIATIPLPQENPEHPISPATSPNFKPELQQTATIPDKAYIWFERSNLRLQPIPVPEDTKQMLDSFLDHFINNSSFYESPLAQMATPIFHVNTYKDRETGKETLTIAFYIQVKFPDANFKTEPLVYPIPETKEELFSAVEIDLLLFESIPAFINQLNGLYPLSRQLFLDEAKKHGYKEKSHEKFVMQANGKAVTKPVEITYSSEDFAFRITTNVVSEGTIGHSKKSFRGFYPEFTLGLDQDFLETYTKYFQQEVAKEWISKERPTQDSRFARIYGDLISGRDRVKTVSDDFANGITLETFNERINRLRVLLPDLSIDSASPDNLIAIKDQLKRMEKKGNVALHPDKQLVKDSDQRRTPQEYEEFTNIFVLVKAFYEQQEIIW